MRHRQVSMPRTAFPCAQPLCSIDSSALCGVSMPRTAFPCAQLIKMMAEGAVLVSMPRTAFPCAQRRTSKRMDSAFSVSMPRTAFPCAQQSIRQLGLQGPRFNAANGISMCTTVERISIFGQSRSFNAANGISMCTTWWPQEVPSMQDMFQCRERHFHVHNAKQALRNKLDRRQVSMPRTAFPCAQLSTKRPEA